MVFFFFQFEQPHMKTDMATSILAIVQFDKFKIRLRAGDYRNCVRLS